MPLLSRLAAKMSTIPLSEIPTLTLLYKLNKLSPSSSPTTSATSRFNNKISLIRTDITKLEIDAIVNAANESLLGGGGVDGAIHRAAGPGLLDECSDLDGCDTGDAKITGAYNLPCKKVIHAVGPVYYATKRKGMHATLLQSCYTKSLDLAVGYECKSIAFSALSTGVYGYPSEEAAETAIQAVKGWLEEDEERAGKIERVVFCQFMEKDERAYEKYIPQYFVPAEAATEEEDMGESTEAQDNAVEADKDGSADQPKTSKEEEITTGAEAEAEKVPELPDVPTQEPKDADQPAVKKLKLDEDAKA